MADVSPRAIAPAKALAIVELRRKRLTQARIAQALGVSASTVSRVLARAGLSHWPPGAEPGAHEHQAPAICCTSTSRSWDVSSALAPGHGQPTRYR
ncbi:DNA-binding helix-turn-helix protein [Bordetella pertussis H939]|nr:DNA-binding helix-turn-helix protein [Bordetella pertussis H939]